MIGRLYAKANLSYMNSNFFNSYQSFVRDVPNILENLAEGIPEFNAGWKFGHAFVQANIEVTKGILKMAVRENWSMVRLHKELFLAGVKLGENLEEVVEDKHMEIYGARSTY